MLHDEEVWKIPKEAKVTVSSTDSVWDPALQYKDSLRASTSQVSSEFDINFEEEEKEIYWSQSSTIFSRSTLIECTLEDFQYKKVIGKGAFGKVYLVESKKVEGQMYAMKVIRKDKIIDFQ